MKKNESKFYLAPMILALIGTISIGTASAQNLSSFYKHKQFFVRLSFGETKEIIKHGPLSYSATCLKDETGEVTFQYKYSYTGDAGFWYLTSVDDDDDADELTPEVFGILEDEAVHIDDNIFDPSSESDYLEAFRDIGNGHVAHGYILNGPKSGSYTLIISDDRTAAGINLKDFLEQAVSEGLINENPEISDCIAVGVVDLIKEKVKKKHHRKYGK